WVSRNRAEGAVEAAISGAAVIVMDDGHQNGSVAKALSLVVVDGETRDGEWPFGGGQMFPAGPMREPLQAGLARADAVVLLMPGDLGRPDPELLALFGDTPVLVARLEPAAEPPPGPQLGFAGVGKPWKVERSLRAAGCRLIDFAAFPDHFAYDEATLEALWARAQDAGAGLVTTEKDWVRLPVHWRARVKAWPVRARFVDPGLLDRLPEPTLPYRAVVPESKSPGRGAGALDAHAGATSHRPSGRTSSRPERGRPRGGPCWRPEGCWPCRRGRGRRCPG